ncbi:hypothetical protein HDEF_1178 [Candidatus Hamiltonella defensa 5AT (Acyrthosiphon pisum)]|uniref:Uncharacterized protein n=1 Tax=Hamiltonella defensa subsp. Acyrthosiphon pisum (strain 5AT) TaxID=572265 RepID=C4K5J6_HAMD5|nr:hypothetical protein HDEF_1178 [Candidatus Hamiltonella defensa 5AT (Acyrthosiphon pisum)]
MFLLQLISFSFVVHYYPVFTSGIINHRYARVSFHLPVFIVI